MKKLIRTLEKIWISVTFAEAGEQETARQYMGPEMDDAESTESCLTA